VGLIAWWFIAAQLPIPENEKTKPSNQILSSDWYLGNPNAAIKIVEYSDFQCPACSRYSGIGEQLVALLGDQIGFAYRHFPLREIHPNANLAAQATEVAGKSGKFWEMAQILFTTQQEWSESTQPLVQFVNYAQQIGLDGTTFAKQIDDKDVKALVEADYLSALVLKINATPTFYVNGQKLNNLNGPNDLIARIELALQEATAAAELKN
jgi:protein-disulfide isomerase